MRTRKQMITMAGAALLGLVALASCSKESGSSGEPGRIPNDGLIRLSAGLVATTKSAVNTGDEFTAAVGGWESATGAEYTKKRTWLSTAKVSASAAAAGITLRPAQYYSQNGAAKTYMKAWYPEGTLSDDGKVSFVGDAAYKGDGTDDVLLAGEVSGSALDAATKTLNFLHPLTQLKFTVQGDALFGESTQIKRISVKDAGVPMGLNLKDDALICEERALDVPNASGTTIVSANATPAGEAVMVRPFGSKTFKIDVTTETNGQEIDYRDVVVTVSDDNTLAGKAYTIALSFAGFEITAQASVAEWDYSGTGSGDVTID